MADDVALFEINEKSSIPIWLQLKNRFIYLITSGYYKPGDQLPTVRGLASEISINYNTVNKAYLSLVSDGYLESTRGRGVFVRGLDADVGDEHAQEIDAILGDCVASCRDLGLTLDDVQKCMARKIKQMKREAGEEPAGGAGGGRIVEIDVGRAGRASQTGA